MPYSKFDCVMSFPEAGMVIAAAAFPVEPERLFEALTDTVEIGRWWGGQRGGSSITWVGRPETGASWQAEGAFSRNRVFLASGRFLEVDRPRRLVQSWQSCWAGLLLSEASLRFEPAEGGTALSLVHKGFDGHKDACLAQAQMWWKVIKWLHPYLSGREERRAAS